MIELGYEQRSVLSIDQSSTTNDSIEVQENLDRTYVLAWVKA